jgi:hypothetical protein
VNGQPDDVEMAGRRLARDEFAVAAIKTAVLVGFVVGLAAGIFGTILVGAILK